MAQSTAAEKRSRSDSQLSSMQADVNKNVDWIRSHQFWWCYVLGLVLFRFACWAVMPKWPGSDVWEWTALAVAHGLVSFLALHWVRGTPFWEDQGQYIEATMWEQIDNGVPWTSVRKFLMIVPVGIFLVSAHSIVSDTLAFSLNLGIALVLVLAKLPELHGVRIFGLNRAHLE